MKKEKIDKYRVTLNVVYSVTMYVLAGSEQAAIDQAVEAEGNADLDFDSPSNIEMEPDWSFHEARLKFVERCTKSGRDPLVWPVKSRKKRKPRR